MEPKLLTKDHVVELAAMSTNERLAFLRERGLVEPEPDPLLVEAREIAAQACEQQGELQTAEFVRTCRPDQSTTLAAALAALKRGRELAPRVELTREMVENAHIKTISTPGQGGFYHRLHAALQEQLKEAGRG